MPTKSRDTISILRQQQNNGIFCHIWLVVVLDRYFKSLSKLWKVWWFQFRKIVLLLHVTNYEIALSCRPTTKNENARPQATMTDTILHFPKRSNLTEKRTSSAAAAKVVIWFLLTKVRRQVVCIGTRTAISPPHCVLRCIHLQISESSIDVLV